ncbi:skin secretory protein xP2-like [Panicum miliaceum]|uniref:Skin secretory protein xP2-like n=1 Tax=Panicum miliaceum TaxID=4540 RepID=A0A3L6RSL1_PANMI|nr:skin secretory protein xP2-like [Panicum miliaceum]
MGACATKPGDLKVKGEAPLVAEDAAAAPVASEEKAKADVVVPAAAEADPADASRRRSLSDLLKQEASAATEQDGAAGELKGDPHGDVQAVVEEEKSVDPDSVQVVVPPAAAAAPSAEEGKVADDASA